MCITWVNSNELTIFLCILFSDSTDFVDPFYGKSGHDAPVNVDTSGSSHADLSVSSSGHGTGNNLLPGVSYVTDVGSSGDRKKTNVHGSHARTGGPHINILFNVDQTLLILVNIKQCLNENSEIASDNVEQKSIVKAKRQIQLWIHRHLFLSMCGLLSTPVRKIRTGVDSTPHIDRNKCLHVCMNSYIFFTVSFLLLVYPKN